eukprot:5435671-Pyramimonas_sp.AAC.1
MGGSVLLELVILRRDALASLCMVVGPLCAAPERASRETQCGATSAPLPFSERAAVVAEPFQARVSGTVQEGEPLR